MLDLLVFTQHPKAYAPIRFLQEAKNMDLRIKIYEYTKIKDINKLPESKAVILREPDFKNNLYELRDSILKHYQIHNSLILNYKSYSKWSVLDKITQHQEFEKAGIPHISLLKLSNAKYPFITKNKLGSHGDNVYKITCKEDLKKVLLMHKADDLLCQEFQTSGFDLRVIVLGGRVLGIMKRTPKTGEFLSNFSQGGTVTRYEVNGYKDIKIVEEIATKTTNHFKLDYVGVDLMMGNDSEWKVLEVNRACQFKGFEKTTGVNVAKELINYLKAKQRE